MFEKSEFSNEIGAAITITPNATKLLDRWGFSHDRAGGVPQLLRREIKYDTMEKLSSDSLECVPLMYGAPFNSYHRADLHGELMNLALGEKGPGLPATLRLAHQVAELDFENGEITLRDGAKIRKDLVVVASGQWVRLN
jgi:salicylate hydroxylase